LKLTLNGHRIREQAAPAPDLPPGLELTLGRILSLVYQPRVFGDKLRRRFGDAATLFAESGPTRRAIAGDAAVVVLSAAGARQVLAADPEGYDALWKQAFSGITGPGSLWVLGGEAHKRERHLLSPGFHAQAFRGFGDEIRALARSQTGQWRPGQTLRALDTTLAISLGVILRVVFGAEDDEFQEGRRVLRRLWGTVHPLIVFFPLSQRPWFPLWVRHTRAKAAFSSWVWQLLSRRRAVGLQGGDVLGRMMAARDEDGNPMSDEAIRDELITILLAGHETTATALAWALYDLAKNPAELQHLRSELDALGPEPPPETVVKAPFLGAVCNETLRLHTLLAEVGRVLVAPLALCGHTIPAGDTVIISAMAVHHDPLLYPEPDRYMPDRFMTRTYAPSEFLPFGGGHRRCLGAALSDYEMRITLAEIVSNWEFETAGEEKEIRHDIAMGPKHGVRLRITGQRSPLPHSAVINDPEIQRRHLGGPNNEPA
jgi:cytochrome P450